MVFVFVERKEKANLEKWEWTMMIKMRQLMMKLLLKII